MSDLGRRRHLARQRALELLYEAEMKGVAVAVVLNGLNVTVDEYARELALATERGREGAEAKIAQNATHWPLERMSVIDRLIMTMALAELAMDDAPPKAVVLDEAVELAHIFSSDEAPAFVNGVLAACVREG